MPRVSYVYKISGGKILESQNTSSVEDTDEVHMAFLENESYQKITLMEENYLDFSKPVVMFTA